MRFIIFTINVRFLWLKTERERGCVCIEISWKREFYIVIFHCVLSVCIYTLLLVNEISFLIVYVVKAWGGDRGGCLDTVPPIVSTVFIPFHINLVLSVQEIILCIVVVGLDSAPSFHYSYISLVTYCICKALKFL